MNKEELVEHAEELQQTIDNHNDELQGREEAGYDKAILEMDGIIDKAFSAGFSSGFYANTDAEMLRALLNFKMEEKL